MHAYRVCWLLAALFDVFNIVLYAMSYTEAYDGLLYGCI
jgi:nicotinamide riboside transporter PnuC